MNAKLVTRNLSNRRNTNRMPGMDSCAYPADKHHYAGPVWARYDATREDAKFGYTWVGSDTYGRGIVHGPDADTDPAPFSRERF